MKDIEIIVIDDCSPDFTPELMDWYRNKDERIKYKRLEQNGGVCEARNYGNQLAQAEIICVSDQDDISMRKRALYSYHYLLHHPDIHCLTSAYWECDVDGQQLKLWEPVSMNREIFESGAFQWMHSSCAYRKKDALELPYRKEDPKTDDWVFLDDWTKAGRKFFTTPTVLANCRRVPWGVMAQRRMLQGTEPNYIL